MCGGDCWEIKDQIGEKNFRGGQKFSGGLLGEMPKKGGKTFWRFQKVVGIFWGSQKFFGGRIFQEKFKKKKSPAGILWKIVQTNLGGSYTGGRVWGECWEIKDKIGEKQIQGARDFWGGGLFGEMPKKGWKNFLAVPKSGGNFFGGHNNFLGGRIFQEKFFKKKSPGGILWKIVPKKFRGDLLGGVVYRGTCVGECWEIKDKIGEKKISGGPEIFGGTFGGNSKKGWKNFLGGVLGEL